MDNDVRPAILVAERRRNVRIYIHNWVVSRVNPMPSQAVRVRRGALESRVMLHLNRNIQVSLSFDCSWSRYAFLNIPVQQRSPSRS